MIAGGAYTDDLGGRRLARAQPRKTGVGDYLAGLLGSRAMQPRGDGPVRVILGTMNFGARTSADESRRVLARALERGVTHWDTANAYAEGASEVLVGEVLRAHRDRGAPPAVQLATKVGIGTLKGPAEGLAPDTVTRALEASLRRLGVPRVDLYYLHKPDPQTPLADTLRA